jgi:tripartite-type tricarboxylate transporter receptor subunit TctC
MLAAGAAPVIVRAQQFPSRPITLICPFPPGGSTDATLRAFATAVSKTLGQPVNVENRPGVSGTMGAAAMVSARPDGYMLTQGNLSQLRLPQIQKLSFDPLKDLTYIICVTGYTYGLAARADSSWKTLQDAMDWARSNPGRLAYGSAGVGTTPHVGMELIAAQLGAKVLHVPFKGGAELMQALLGGHIMLISDSTSWAPIVNDGRARLLVTWGAERTKSWPTVPTLRDLGVDLVLASPWGIVGPAAMDAQVVKILHDAFRKALDDEPVRQTLDRYDQPVIHMNSEAYADYSRKQFVVEGQLVEKFGLRVMN